MVYLQNKDIIDEQICQANEFANAQLANGRQITEKYANDAAARARATAADLTQKVHEYASKKSPTVEKSQAASFSQHDGPSHEFPDVPRSEVGADSAGELRAAPEPLFS